MVIYFWDRERKSMNGRGSEREGGTESEAGSRLWAVSTEPDAGLELTDSDIMTWAEVRRLTDWATQHPSDVLLNTEREGECIVYLRTRLLAETKFCHLSWEKGFAQNPYNSQFVGIECVRRAPCMLL